MPARPQWLIAGLSLCLLALAPAGAAARTSPPAAQLRAVPGSVLPLLRGAVRLAATPATTPVDVSVALHPRRPALLAYTAAHSSADPLSPAQLRTLFAPRAAHRAK